MCTISIYVAIITTCLLGQITPLFAFSEIPECTGLNCRIIFDQTGLPKQYVLKCVPSGADAACQKENKLALLAGNYLDVKSLRPMVCFGTLVPCPGGYDCVNGQCCYDKPAGVYSKPCLEKPGSCPALDKRIRCDYVPGVMKDLCTLDSDCKGGEKCCNTICAGKACKSPVVKVVEKPGSCPALDKRIMCGFNPWGGFKDLCTSDSDCKGGEKCCNTICAGKACKSPVVKVVEKPGSCPALDKRIMCGFNPWGGFKDLCTSDSDCKGGEKCCNTICAGKACKSPTITREGFCPPLDKGIMCDYIPSVMEDLCKSDGECDAHQKCCNNECSGRKCKVAIMPYF